MNTIGLLNRDKYGKNWKKLLYLKQNFPDNYTDESFLSQLKRNETVTIYSYWELVNDFSLILFHLNNLLLVLLLFASIYQFNWDPTRLIVFSSIVSLVSFVVWGFKLNKLRSRNLLKLKTFIIIIFMLIILSPVLKSLTRSTASDSIWSISFLLTLSNLVFHDYAMNPKVPFYKPIISTNLSLSNALVLASRLQSTWQAFCFIFIALQINILLPIFDFSLRKTYPVYYHHGLFFILAFVVLYLLYKLCNTSLILLWGSSQFFIVFLMPGYFLFLQRYKNELSGPWDIAKPVIPSS